MRVICSNITKQIAPMEVPNSLLKVYTDPLSTVSALILELLFDNDNRSPVGLIPDMVISKLEWFGTKESVRCYVASLFEIYSSLPILELLDQTKLSVSLFNKYFMGKHQTILIATL